MAPGAALALAAVDLGPGPGAPPLRRCAVRRRPRLAERRSARRAGTTPRRRGRTPRDPRVARPASGGASSRRRPGARGRPCRARAARRRCGPARPRARLRAARGRRRRRGGRPRAAVAAPAQPRARCDEPGERLVADPEQILVVLEHRAERRLHVLDVELLLPERGQGAHPVDRLGDARAASGGRATAARPRTRAASLGQPFRHAGDAQLDDLDLALDRRVVDPVVEAAPLERVVQLARPVRGQDHVRPLLAR